ncbi:sulfotransferase-like domain-containing protein [Marixanthomonas spongiae]|uniref:Sulfotransferase family protein n=1 Tax=Marixanthomonas spongiae TaxID=2174845 RepID=A0A2U0HZD3_9FLAO|nr:sulfotransferase family protein [Marixanthomonas spongiae]PVW14241.1 sulfotransferase family protein [Marixanthomonas spongiae]
MKIVNLISGPRNLSTALMYSFAQREDFAVMDEPFYGYYLKNTTTQTDHPATEEILNTMDLNLSSIIASIQTLSSLNHVFVKGMAHHYISEEPDFILKWDNLILIRHPEKLLLSFSKVIDNPKLEDIGIKKASEMFLFLKQNGRIPTVIDSDELMKAPEAYLKKICHVLNVPYTSKMISWPKGGIPEDGIWAPYWYKNVHNSEGFQKQKRTQTELPNHLKSVLKEAMPYYNTLKKHIIKND